MNVRRAYRLQAVDGHFLPVGGETDATVILFENGTFVSAPTYPPDQPVPDVGTYTINDAGDISFTEDSTTYGGIINEALLAITAGGSEYIFTRETAL